MPHWPRDRYLELSPKYWAETRSRLDPEELEKPIGPLTGSGMDTGTGIGTVVNNRHRHGCGNRHRQRHGHGQQHRDGQR